MVGFGATGREVGILEDLGNLGGFVGGLAVIITLVYLANQVRQNTKALHTASRQHFALRDPAPVGAAPPPLVPPFEGGCLCGAVRYCCIAAPFVSYTCHCRACQQLTASAFATCLQVPEEALEVTRGDPVEKERQADSGNRLTTRFCGACGSALFVGNAARPRLRTIYAGTLDEPGRVQVNAHIFTSRALPWVQHPPGHRVFPEAGDWRPDYASDPTRLEG